MFRINMLAVILCLIVYACNETGEQPVEGNFSGQLTQEEISTGILTPEILWKFGRVSDMQLSPDGTGLIFNVTRYDAGTNTSVTDIYRIGSSEGTAVLLTDTGGKYLNPRWKPDSSGIGFLSSVSGSFQLWEMDVNGENLRQVSGIDGDINSFEYAPDGAHILYTKDVLVDRTPLEMYPDLPLANVRIIDDLMYRHWNAWNDYRYSHIFVAQYGGTGLGESVDIMEDEPWDSPLSPYFDGSEISWTPDGSAVAYTCKKMKGRDYTLSTNSDIYLYDLQAGTTKNLTEGMPGYDKYPSFSHDGKKMAFMSMETPGYESDKERLFIMDMETGEKKYMTAGWDRNAEHYTWSGDDSSIYFIGGINATYQVFELETGSGEIKQLTSGKHDYTSIALSEDVLTGTRMSMSMATEIFRIDTGDGSDTQLTSINGQIYDKIGFGNVEERWVKTTDNKDMLVWVIYPPDFDPSKKYPALLYCQGGPQSAVSQFFSYRWNFQLMAANGYIVVAPNRRGLPTFGTAWNRQISGDWGGQNMKDYLSAIDALKAEEFVDENRLGAVGASYGGYSVFYLAGMHEGRFKTFISHCGVFDLVSMYGSTEESFFPNFDLGGAYWESPRPKSYEFSPHLYVQNWDTPILIITSGNDMRVPYTQSLEAFNAAQLRGIPSRLLFYPEESHWILKPQNGILWHREFFGWLDRWLKQ